MQCISPVNGRLYAERPYVESAALAKAISQAKQAYQFWSKTSLKERKAYIEKFLQAVLDRSPAWVPELAWQMGRPVIYQGEFKPFQERVMFLLEQADRALADIVPEDHKAGIARKIKRVPLGITLIISPWNYPYITAVNAIVPALLAGNVVILKPAAQTLLVGEHFQQSFDQAGLPPYVFQNLLMDHKQTEQLILSGDVQHLTFTGSVEGGRIMEKMAAGRFASLTLELGGKDPALVRQDADIEFAAQNLAEGAFYNSGQCCCGIERIYVAEKVYPQFLEAFAAETRKLKLGNPLETTTTLGPVANASLANKVRSHIQEAQTKGAKALLPDLSASQKDLGTTYLAPQILVDVDHSMLVMKEETFGPVVGVMAVKNDQQAIAWMNDSVYGLTASIWTRDLAVAEALGDQIETGTVFMNRCDYLDPALAWTGTKETGKGQSLSVLGIQSYTRPKSYHLRYEI